MRAEIAPYVYPAVVQHQTGVMYSCDNDRFTNHSLTPNTGTYGDWVIALRDIRANEEITANYFHFVRPHLPHFFNELGCYAFLLGNNPIDPSPHFCPS